MRGDGEFDVAVNVSNAGGVPGREIVQLYVAPVDPRVERPAKELKGFADVTLSPGEAKKVVMRLSRRDFAYWDVLSHDWTADAGEYRLLVGPSSADIRREAVLSLQ